MIIEQFDPLRGQIVQVIEEGGRPRADLEPRLSAAELQRIYSLMVLTRAADQKAVKLQRQGRLGTYAPGLGHEACQVGTAFAFHKEDWAFPYFRDLGLYLTLGYPLADYYLYWMGNEAGMRTPEGLNLFPLAIPVASQIPHSVGAGLGARLQKKPIAVVCTFGDGATSEGDFHEALNFAGVFRTPNVFVCYNNQWAISTPRSRQTASATIAQKALAYGFPGVAVDGNDVLAVLAVVREARERARRGDGPTLIEALTYRMGHHTTSDDASKYRPEAEVKEWEKKDPLLRFQATLKVKGLWNAKFESDLQERAAREVEEAVSRAESVPPPAAEDIFVHTFKEMPPQLQEQLAALKGSPREGQS
ncbi:MAG: pyruvate dehydrogenase (acetyl-transferring) E1 component subunit alpha [Candidatus Aminicenantales bacterium]